MPPAKSTNDSVPSKSVSKPPCIRHLTSRTCRPGPNRSCKYAHFDASNKAPPGILTEHHEAISKVPRPKDLSQSRCAAAGISYEKLYNTLAEPRLPSINPNNRASRTSRMTQPGTVCGLFSANNKRFSHSWNGGLSASRTAKGNEHQMPLPMLRPARQKMC